MADDDNIRPVDPDASTADLGTPSSAALPKQLGHYPILEQIGARGMGTVLLAEPTHTAQRVASRPSSASSAGESAA